MSGTGTSIAKVQKPPLKVGDGLTAHRCGCVWCTLMSGWPKTGGAEGSRITQSPKGEFRFHPIGNEEPLKDFKSSQVLPGWCVRKQAPGCTTPGTPLPGKGQAVPSFPEDGLSCCPHFSSVSG